MRWLLIIALVFTVVACSPAPAAEVVIPTLIVLPSVTPIPPSPLPPTNTFTPAPPTSTSTETATSTDTSTSTFTASPTSSNTPTPEPCDVEGWWDSIEEPLTEFFDVAEVAVSTSRMSLAPVILELQRTYRDFQRIDVPDCGDLPDTAREMGLGMSTAIDAFNEFLADSGIEDVYFSLANQYFWNAHLQDGLWDGDIRALTASFIWGGDEGSDAEATNMTVDRTRFANERTATAAATTKP